MARLNSRSLTAKELEQLRVYVPDFSALQKSLSLSSLRIIENAQKMVQSQMENIREAIKAVATSKEFLKGFTFPNPNIYWPAAYIDVSPVKKETLSIIPTPSQIIALDDSASQRARLGLRYVKGGFTYKRKILSGLSIRSKHGRFLRMLVLSPTFYVDDDEIYSKLDISEGRSFSWVRRNLINAFKKNGLKITVERRNPPRGYVLISVKYLQ